jgi:hypothetical protein
MQTTIKEKKNVHAQTYKTHDKKCFVKKNLSDKNTIMHHFNVFNSMDTI